MAADPRLTPEEKRRFVEWLNIRSIKSCPMCKSSKWGIADHLVAPPPFAGPGEVPADMAYPMAMLVCGNCAYTAFFNAAVVGLLRDRKDDESSA